MLPFDPRDWYWLKADGKVYSSARRASYAQSNEVYRQWLAKCGAPTEYPKDEAGEESEQVLADILRGYGVYLTIKEELAAYAAQRRWEVETGSISVGGVQFGTDDRTKTLLTGARIKADANPSFSTRWKVAGNFVLIGSATIIAASEAVFSHVDNCFAAEADINELIESGGITTKEQIDEYDWPA